MSYHVFILPNLTQLSVIQYFFNKKNFLTNRNNSSVTILNSYNLYNVNFDDESRYPATPNPTPRDTRILQTNYIIITRDFISRFTQDELATNFHDQSYSTPCCYFNYSTRNGSKREIFATMILSRISRNFSCTRIKLVYRQCMNLVLYQTPVFESFTQHYVKYSNEGQTSYCYKNNHI